MAGRAKMAREERAKQFMPFAALKGYPEALRAKEKVVVARTELAEDYKEELNWQLAQIKQMDVISVVYFSNGEYLKVTGVVSRLDVTARVLKVVQTKIAFDDIMCITRS